jgi:hypothetical protein
MVKPGRARRNRKWLLWSAVLVTLVSSVLVLLVVGVLFLNRGDEQSDSLLPRLQGNEQRLVTDYLVRTLDDPSDMEIVEWADPRFVLLAERDKPKPLFGPNIGVIRAYKPGIIMQVNYRAKSPFGGKVMHKERFLIQEGKLVALRWVGQLGEIAVERVGRKLEKVIVRGTISLKAGAITKGLRVVFHEEGAAPSSSGGEVATGEPMRYEVVGITPGKYRVAIGHDDEKAGRVLFGKAVVFYPRYSPTKTPLFCDVTDEQEIQHFDFDFKGE